MARPAAREEVEGVAAYKGVLAAVIDRRPSGTRQRLAVALGKNRSFISQITNPAYATPIPASHINIIFEQCHFTAAERRQFLDLYHAAHPGRLALAAEKGKSRPLTLQLPELGDDARNEELLALVSTFVRELAQLFNTLPPKRSRP